MDRTALTGRSFDVDLGPFIPHLDFLNDNQMHLTARIGDDVIDEVVDVEVATVRPEVFLVSWTEKSGNYIVQLQDHEKRIVHNRARLADGQVFQVEGVIRG
jgi:hypothetical protein